MTAVLVGLIVCVVLFGLGVLIACAFPVRSGYLGDSPNPLGCALAIAAALGVLALTMMILGKWIL